MHKIIAKSIIAMGFLMLSQTNYAQVGIGTTNPQQELHIAGTDPATKTIRIEALNSTNSPLNDGVLLAPLAINADGDIVISDSGDALTSNMSATAGTFLTTPVSITTVEGEGTDPFKTYNSGSLFSSTFDLTEETLIELNTEVAITILDENGDPITDNLSRMYGMGIYVNGNRTGYDSDTFTCGETNLTGLGNTTSTYNVGYFTLSASGYITLPAGTHTIDVVGFVTGVSVETDNLLSANTYDYYGTTAEFGDSFSSLTIIEHK